MATLAETPNPPYYAVIFSSIRTNADNGYAKMAMRMEQLASEEQGYLGIESAREETGITVSYWDSLEAIQRWKVNVEHKVAQQQGKADWYSSYKVRIAKVERDYEF